MRVVRSVAALACGKVVLSLGSLLLVPLYLSQWSATRYGEWLSVFAAVAYLATLDLGMNMGAINRLTQAHAVAHAEDYRSVQRAGLAFYVAMAGAGTLALTVIVLTAPLGRWLALSSLSSEEVSASAWLLGCLMLWSLPSGFIVGAYRSTGAMATSQWIGTAQHAITLGAIAVALLLGAGPVIVAALHLIVLVVLTVAVVMRLRSRHPALAPTLGTWRRGTLPALLRSSALFVLVLAASALTLQGSVLIVSIGLSGVAVALFVTTRTLANVIRQVVNTLVIAMWPEVTRLEARGEQRALRTAHAVLVVVTSAACIAFAAALWWEGAEVVSVWTRGMLSADVPTLRLFLVLLVLQSPWLVGFGFGAASNRHGSMALACLVGSVLGLVLAVLLMPRWGTAGVVAGLVLGDALACSHFVVREACRLVGEPYGSFARRLWPNLVLTSLVALGAAWVAHVVVGGPSLVRWSVVGGAASVGALGAAWVCWLTADERQLVTTRVRPVRLALGGVKAEAR
jgi:O-antigen/teichoic acid export membrane protein